MITVMRNKLKANGMSSIIWISLASMLIGSIMPSLFKKDSCEPWAIKINDETIPYRLYMQELARNRDYIARLRAQYGQFADYFLQNMGVQDAQSLTYKQLVTQELMAQKAKAMGIELSESYVGYKLHDTTFVTRYCADILPPQFVDASTGLDTKALRHYLQQRGIPSGVFQQQLQEKVSNWFVHNLVQTYAYTPDYIQAYEYMQKNSTKSYATLLFKHDTFLADVKKETITEDELTQFFDTLVARKAYDVPEKRKGIKWEFTPKAYGIAIDTEAIQQYYEQHKVQKYIDKPAQLHARALILAFNDETRDQVYQQMQSLAAQLQEDESQFENLARTYSTDVTAAKGGLMEPFARGQQEPAIDRAAFILKNDGDISGIIESNGRFVIVQRIKKEQQSFKAFKDVAASIEQELMAKEFARVFGKQAKEAVVSQDASTIEQFVKEHKGTPINVGSSSRKDNKALFGIKHVGNYTFLVEGTRGSIVRLDEIEKEYTPTLESIRSTVISDLYHDKASKQLQQKISHVLAEIRSLGATPSAESLEQIAQRYQLPFERIKDLSESATTLSKELREKGLDPLELLTIEKVGTSIIQENGADRYLISLDSIIPTTTEALGTNLISFKKQLKSQQENAFIGSFIASLHRDATIDTNNTITMIDEENSI